MSSKNNVYSMVLSAMFLAAAILLPFLTGQVPQIGGMLCPMHIPVLLCGFFCGPWYGAAVGFIAPLLRFALFGMPPILPTGVAMAMELMTYGAVSGWMIRILPQRKWSVYPSLLIAMVAGRIIWAGARLVLMGLGQYSFGWTVFLTEGFTSAIPGIILQIVLVPILVMVLRKTQRRI